jgi:predicted neutral ceramidase superfamily lipid hydrolase
VIDPDYYAEASVSRKSPGFFGYINTFQATPFLILLFFGFPLSIGLITTLFHWITEGSLNWMYLIRDSLTFGIIMVSGTVACLFFKDRTPLYNLKISFLINGFGAGMFAVSYLLGHILNIILPGHFIEIFFMIGALVAYIVLFVIHFSFTRVGPPWYIFLALIEPVVGILVYSFISEQVTLIFFLKAMVFFIISAGIFALGYAPMMASVSYPYRRKTGTGGYHFVRAFVECLLIDDHDAIIESYFEKFSETRDLQMQYIGFRDIKTKKLKGLFITPNVHFGPFKTTGSAALTEKIYQQFDDIPGVTVFHTTTTHGQNLVSNQFNIQIINQIKEDIGKFEYQTPQITKFVRVFQEKTKILGSIINNVPFLMFSRHPQPTDDIVPEIGEQIKQVGIENSFKESVVVDCHNCLVGDEILITADSDEGKEMVKTSSEFFNMIKKKDVALYDKIQYGVAKDPMEEIPIASGIGAGGIIVHLFKIGEQETALVHVDANNAKTQVRSAIVNLGENEGLDRIEMSTSDTHAVVRIVSAQGYHPLGSKVSASVIVNKVKTLIEQAREDMVEVDIATAKTTAPGYQFWKDLSYFDLIIETLARSMTVSKVLLTIGLVIPSLLTLMISLFYL